MELSLSFVNVQCFHIPALNKFLMFELSNLYPKLAKLYCFLSIGPYVTTLFECSDYVVSMVRKC